MYRRIVRQGRAGRQVGAWLGVNLRTSSGWGARNAVCVAAVVAAAGIASAAPSRTGPTAAALAPAPALSARDSSARAAQARALLDRAEVAMARNTIDQRRVAMRTLEQASLLRPDDPTYDLALARAYYRAGFLKMARQRYEKVTRLAPDNAQGRFGLGQVWRRDWLKYLDASSLRRAVSHLSTAARLDPMACDVWLTLTPLLVEQGDLQAAAAAAQHAFAADSSRAESRLALAYTAWRLGQVELSASAFASAFPRMRRNLLERFEDISPVATERDTATLHRLPPDGQSDFVRRFWRDVDPDLATPENEAQLEYWSRVAHAYFLYYDAKRREWDERGEIYVRYGPPDRTDYNPVGERLVTRRGGSSAGSQIVSMEFPANIQAWEYKSLGMMVTMMDPVLNEHYFLPGSMYQDPDPVPNADSIARHPDRFATTGGRGVFPKFPPGVRALAVQGTLARFEAGAGGRLLAGLEVGGLPSDSLWADWVVLDSARNEVVRGGRTLAPSACDPTTRRVADFTGEVPPGEYLVGLSVRDGHGRRGVWRSPVRVEPASLELSLSDLVVACGVPEVGAGPPVRIPPNPAAVIGSHEPLSAYFEVYHLAPDANGQGRFQYDYTVRGAEKDPRIWIQRLFQPRAQLPTISASREEENPGPLRRQFVTVPVQSLPPGRYRLDIRVRDLIADVAATRTAEFVKLGEMGPP